jgi:hypothetical protein
VVIDRLTAALAQAAGSALGASGKTAQSQNSPDHQKLT